VVRHHDRNLAPLKPLAPHLGDAFFVAGEGAGGGARLTRRSPWGWIAASCRARNCPQISISSGSGVRFSGGTAFSPRCRCKRRRGSARCPRAWPCSRSLREQLAGAAHERECLAYLIGAGAFTYEDQAGAVGLPDAEDQFMAAFVEPAAAAISDIRPGSGGRVSPAGANDIRRPPPITAS